MIFCTQRMTPHFEILDVPTNSLVKLVSKKNPETVADVHVKFHCQNSEEIGVDEDVMAKRVASSLKQDTGSVETGVDGSYSVLGSLDNTSDTDVGIHFVVTVTPADSTESPLVLDCFASESLRVLRVRGLAGSGDGSELTAGGTDGWAGRIAGEGGPLSPVAPKRRKDLPPLTTQPSPVFMFNSLKTDTQKALMAYLKQLRVDDDLSFFVLCYGRAKEQEQYLQFLEQLVHFTDRGVDFAALGLTSPNTSPKEKKRWK